VYFKLNWKKFIAFSLVVFGTGMVFASSLFSVIDYMFFDANKWLYLTGFGLIIFGVAVFWKK
jgi:hypothetical protein